MAAATQETLSIGMPSLKDRIKEAPTLWPSQILPKLNPYLFNSQDED